MAELETAESIKDWTISDREEFTERWNRANIINLMNKVNGWEEYKTITQRTAFYNWCDQICELQKHDTKWVSAAWIVATQMKNMDDPVKMTALRTLMAVNRVRNLASETYKEPILGVAEAIVGYGRFGSADVIDVSQLIAFGNAGNKAIFDNVFPRLSDLFMRGLKGNPILGDDAKQWDRDTLQNEQAVVVQPIYNQYAAGNRPMQNVLADMASGLGVFKISLMTCPIFSGDIMNSGDRFNHGMNVVVPWIARFKQAIDQHRAMRQRFKPRTVGVVSAG